MWPTSLGVGQVVCKLLNVRSTQGFELGCILWPNWNELVVASFKILSEYLRRRTEEHHEKTQLVSGLIFEASRYLLNLKQECQHSTVMFGSDDYE
jgi:hypothetical protein